MEWLLWKGADSVYIPFSQSGSKLNHLGKDLNFLEPLLFFFLFPSPWVAPGSGYRRCSDKAITLRTGALNCVVNPKSPYRLALVSLYVLGPWYSFLLWGPHFFCPSHSASSLVPVSKWSIKFWIFCKSWVGCRELSKSQPWSASPCPAAISAQHGHLFVVMKPYRLKDL